MNELLPSSVLSWLIALPAIGALLLFAVPASRPATARCVASSTGLVVFLLSLLLLARFQAGDAGMQFMERVVWLADYGVTYSVGVDGLSLWLVLLTTFLTLLVLLASGSVTKRVRAYLGLMLLLETGMLGTFLALDGVTFYLFWELMLIPMYLLIGVWGGSRRVYAALKFVLYTAVGSLLMLVAIVYLAQLHQEQFGVYSFALRDWMKLNFSQAEELWLFGAFALAFLIKIPVFPFHTWLPDAHVEAPTGGSVILAGVLLKMGVYGLLRWAIPVFPYAAAEAQPLLAVLGVIGIVFGALMAWVQTDVKKLVAYSSVSHLGFCVLGLAAANLQSLQGCIIQLINHGISTGALFLIVGVLYDRKHTREIADYSGLSAKVPLFAAVFMVFTLSSIGLPLTNGFIGEFLILVGGFGYWKLLTAIAVAGVILGAVYMLSLYRRMMFGALNEAQNGDLNDLTGMEKTVFAPLLVMVFVIGLCPGPILSRTEPAARRVIASLSFGAEQRRMYQKYPGTRVMRLEMPEAPGRGK